jgi:hypothetical protein
VPGQQRQPYGEAGRGEILGPWPQRLRAAGEAVNQQGSDRPAIVRVRLSAGQDHVGIVPRLPDPRHRMKGTFTP